MKVEEFFTAFFMALIMTGLLALMILIPAMMIDSFTLEEVGEKSVPCLDKYNRPFENELCTKTLTCSWLGLSGDKRCVLVSGDEQ